jgi:uncharacterized protein YjbI with pentapeptide repeats
MRKILASATAAVMVAGGVSLAVASTALAVTCPTVNPLTGAVTPAPIANVVDWSGCDLTGANLSKAALESANLSGANLSGANLTGAAMADANLTGANLTSATLTDGTYPPAYQGNYTDLSLTNLTDANLTGADLTGANLPGARLTGANLTGANLTGARMVNLTGLSGADLTGADLSTADLTGANLTGGDLSGATLTGADLKFAFVTCSDTGFLGGGITGAPINLPSGWQLTGGTLTVPKVACPKGSAIPVSAADCPTVDQATGVVTPRLGPGLNYRGCSFVGANLDGVDLSGAELGSTQWGQNSAVQVVLTGADLSEAVFLGPVNLTRADLTGANLEKADLAEAFVTAAGDTGELGCAITGRPRTLPTRWALANGCLRTKGASADQAPRPCPAVSTPATTPVPFQSGRHPLWAEGDISCAEATAIVEDATEDGTVNSRVLASQMSRVLREGQKGEMWVALSSTESLSVTAELIKTDSASQQRIAPRFRTEVTYRQADDTGDTQRITYCTESPDPFDFGRIDRRRTGICVG